MFHSAAARWSAVLLLGVFLVSSAFVLPTPPADPPEKSFFVANKEGRISSKNKAILLKFYQAIYGKRAQPEAIEIVPYKGNHYVAWQGTGAKVPTMTVQLKMTERGFFLTAASKRNTCTGDPCTRCKFTKSKGCQCGGTGFCNHEGTGIVADLMEPAQVLGLE
ncbi:MAG: hypothetical protein AAF399_19400 [Bacteroidota bacterium]